MKVVAFEQAVSMPFASFWLAEMGADVIKIERVCEGDVVRSWDDVVRGLSSGYVWVNAGKRDIALDLGHEDGRAIAKELALQADVFVENFAPTVAARLGLGHDELLRDHPSLIYCSLSGYGQDGPYRDVKAYDLLVQGEAGILLSNGYPDAPAKVGMPVTDLIGGATVAFGIACALLERSRTGAGTYLDVGMLEAVAPWLGYFLHHRWHAGIEPPRTGMHHQYLVPYGPYQAADGVFVNLVVASGTHWNLFVGEVVRRPEWFADPRLADIEARKVNRPYVEDLITRAIAAEPSSVWFDRLRTVGLPYGAVRDMASVVTHPQLMHRGTWVEAESPVGTIPIARVPLAPQDRTRRVPDLGEHTVDVLRSELGYSDDRIADLIRFGVVGVPSHRTTVVPNGRTEFL